MLAPAKTVQISKFMSLLLRHEPEAGRLTLDSAGWTSVEQLLASLKRRQLAITRDELDHLVETNPKKRFEYSPDGQMIRASQGHSVSVDLQYEPQEPPHLLYHGTASRFLHSIRTTGLQRQQRHHVHLSVETKMTLEVGARRGRPVILTILAGEMHRAGHVFYRSTNGVWLTDSVPADFIRFS